jgi:hypothetical protein
MIQTTLIAVLSLSLALLSGALVDFLVFQRIAAHAGNAEWSCRKKSAHRCRTTIFCEAVH